MKTMDRCSHSKLKFPLEKRIENLESSLAFAKELAEYLIGLDLKESIILFFSGEMGAGKTTLIRTLGESIGVTEKITSPTFLGLNEYYSGKVPFLHLDLYQAQIDFGDLEEIICENNKKIIAIEWSENLSTESQRHLESLATCFEITIIIDGDTSRSIKVIGK